MQFADPAGTTTAPMGPGDLFVYLVDYDDADGNGYPRADVQIEPGSFLVTGLKLPIK